MEKQQKTQLIIDLFEFFMAGITKKKYTINLRDTELKTIEKFIKKIGKEFGQSIEANEWFFEYYEFQFEYWYWLEKSGKLKVKWYYLRPSWIIGDKAFKRYEKYLKNFKFKGKRKIRKTVRVEEQFMPQKIKSVKIDKIKTYEENSKKRFYDTDATLEWCIMTTTLFHPKSEYCQNCAFKKICISTFKKNYPKLSKRRLNEKTSKKA